MCVLAGGGAHHACNNHSDGWCFYADITVGIRKIRSATDGKIQKVLYVDGDVHQGNGVEHDKLTFKDDDLFIVDIYNAGVVQCCRPPLRDMSLV